MSDWTSPPTSSAGYTTTWRACGWCGLIHGGTCPRVKAIEYHPNGQIKRVEFHEQPLGQGVVRVGFAEVDKEPT
jgi:hypothetical protein